MGITPLFLTFITFVQFSDTFLLDGVNGKFSIYNPDKNICVRFDTSKINSLKRVLILIYFEIKKRRLLCTSKREKVNRRDLLAKHHFQINLE